MSCPEYLVKGPCLSWAFIVVRHIKKTLFTACIAAIGFAAPAMAWEGNAVVCYDEHLVPAKYTYTKHMVKDSKKQYEHRKGRIELVSYPAILPLGSDT